MELPNNHAQCVFHGRVFHIASTGCPDCNAETTFSGSDKPVDFGYATHDMVFAGWGRYPDTKAEIQKAAGAGNWATGVWYSSAGTELSGTTESPESILDRAIDFVEARLPNGIELLFERNVARRSYDVFAQCPHCGTMRQTSDITEHMVEDAVSMEALGFVLCQGVYNVLGKCVVGDCCDPLDRYVDGKRVRDCLEAFEMWQRGDVGRYAHMRGKWVWPEYKLTPLQLSAARLAWSVSLREKQQEQREKERVEIVCERDEDGE